MWKLAGFFATIINVRRHQSDEINRAMPQHFTLDEKLSQRPVHVFVAAMLWTFAIDGGVLFDDGDYYPVGTAGNGKAVVEGDVVSVLDAAVDIANQRYSVSKGHIGWAFPVDRAPQELFERGAVIYSGSVTEDVGTSGYRKARLFARQMDEIESLVPGIQKNGGWVRIQKLVEIGDRGR